MSLTLRVVAKLNELADIEKLNRAKFHHIPAHLTLLTLCKDFLKIAFRYYHSEKGSPHAYNIPSSSIVLLYLHDVAFTLHDTETKIERPLQ